MQVSQLSEIDNCLFSSDFTEKFENFQTINEASKDIKASFATNANSSRYNVIKKVLLKKLPLTGKPCLGARGIYRNKRGVTLKTDIRRKGTTKPNTDINNCKYKRGFN